MSRPMICPDRSDRRTHRHSCRSQSPRLVCEESPMTSNWNRASFSSVSRTSPIVTRLSITRGTNSSASLSDDWVEWKEQEYTPPPPPQLSLSPKPPSLKHALLQWAKKVRGEGEVRGKRCDTLFFVSKTSIAPAPNTEMLRDLDKICLRLLLRLDVLLRLVSLLRLWNLKKIRELKGKGQRIN